jgi:hypothetical protein
MKMPFDQALTKFLIVAGRSARQAEQILGAEGSTWRFDSRDIAAFATTLLIHAARAEHLSPCEDWPRGDAA